MDDMGTIDNSDSTAKQNASLWLSEELVDRWHDFGGLVMHKASESMHCVTPPLLVIF
jgi:hypothetical protein